MDEFPGIRVMDRRYLRVPGDLDEEGRELWIHLQHDPWEDEGVDDYGAVRLVRAHHDSDDPAVYIRFDKLRVEPGTPVGCLIMDSDEEFTVPENQRVWLSVDNLSVLVNRTHEGVIVDVWALGLEDDDRGLLATMGVMYQDAEEAHANMAEARKAMARGSDHE